MSTQHLPLSPITAAFPRWLTLVGCSLLLAGLGWVDFLTGYELGFFVFYSAPVGLAAWYAGRWPAILIALAASVTWWLADKMNGVSDSSRFFFSWNLTVHFLAFVINAVTISKIKGDIDERQALLIEIADLRARAATLPPCPACGAPIPPRADSAAGRMTSTAG
jgi:hypothetical protein